MSWSEILLLDIAAKDAMEDAKTEVEKPFSDESLTVRSIKKLARAGQ